MRQKQREVSSLFLWRLASRNLAADHRRHRLIRSLILAAQLTVLTLLALALAGPKFAGSPAPVQVGLIVDTSASMAAGVGVSRAFLAAQAAERFLSDGEAARYLLWTTTGARLRYDGSSKEQLLAALRRLPPPGGTSDWIALHRDVAARLEQDAPAILVLVTDGAVDAEQVEPLLSLGLRTNLYVIDVGSSLDNVAITGLFARASGRVDGHHQVLIEVENFSRNRIETRLSVTSLVDLSQTSVGSQETIYAADIHLEPRERQRLLLDHVLRSGEILQAAIALDDALAVDDRAYLAASLDEPIQVLFIGEPNRFLVEGLSAFSYVRLSHSFEPQAVADARASVDLAVFYGEPLVDGPWGAALVFAADAPEGREQARPAEITWWDRRHPLSRFIDWENVSLGRVSPLTPAAGEQTILESTAGPLITVLDESGRRIVRVGLLLNESDFPFRVAFPVFLQNVLEWIRPAGNERVPPPSPPGKVPEVVAMLAAEGETLTLITPTGDIAELTPALDDDDELYRLLLVPGVYSWQTQGRAGRFAVSLLDRSESDLTSRLAGSLAALGAISIDPAVDRLAQLLPITLESSERPPSYLSREEDVWTWVALAVIGLLLVEGHLYTARRLARPFRGPLAAGRPRSALRDKPTARRGVAR